MQDKILVGFVRYRQATSFGTGLTKRAILILVFFFKFQSKQLYHIIIFQK